MRCVSNKYYLFNGKCVPCSENIYYGGHGCKTCDSKKCLCCVNDKYYNKNGVCISCSSTCKQCITCDSTGCTSCVKGYKLCRGVCLLAAEGSEHLLQDLKKNWNDCWLLLNIKISLF